MTVEKPAGKISGAGPDAGDDGAAAPPSRDDELEALREILLSSYRQRITGLEAELADVEQRINDKDALVATITPVLGDAIRQKIREGREEMIEALYPIIGQLVVRAVSEAIRDLARQIDARMRTTFSFGALWQRVRASLRGVSGAELSLREALPFAVAEVFLIHRETGLLLWHVSRAPGEAADSDLISGMLTAIRDFVQDTFGRGQAGQLDEIQYGERRILIEAAQHCYLAVVVDGVEPAGYRAEMREQVIAIEHAHEQMLRDYDGDAAALASVEPALRSLMSPAEGDTIL